MTNISLLSSLRCAALIVCLVSRAWAQGSAPASPATPSPVTGASAAAPAQPSPAPATTPGPAAPPNTQPSTQPSTQPGTQPASHPNTAHPQGSNSAANLKFRAEHPLVVRGGQGSTTFILTNDTDTPIAVSLTPGPITDARSYAALPAARTVLSSPSATPPSTAPAPPAGAGSSAAPAAPAGAANGPATPAFAHTVPPHQEISVHASVTGVTGASTAVIPIYNGSVQLGEIALYTQDAPLNIAIDGAGSTTTPLIYEYDQPVRVVLKNNDSQPYLLHWIFQIGGKEIAGGDQRDQPIPANGPTWIQLKDSCTPFWRSFWRPRPGACEIYGWFDWVHPTTLNGTLVISESSAGAPNLEGLLPARTLPVSLRMYRLGELGTELWTYGWVVLFLTLGGFLSYMASSVLPNTQRKADLRAQLHDLANRTSTVSTRVDSYLRVLLRLERSRIADALDSASAWIPASTDPFAQIPAAIDILNRRLTAAERLDELSRKHDRISTIAPPSVTDTIDVILQAAADQLHSAALSDTELTAANLALNKAQAALDLLDDSDAMAKLIAGNLTNLQTRIDKYPPGYYSDIQQALPGIFVVLNDKYKDPKNIVGRMLFAIDHAVAAMHLVLDYAIVRASIPTLEGAPAAPAAPPPADGGAAAAPVEVLPGPNSAALSARNCVGLGDVTRERLAKRQCVLIELLGKLSWQGLRDANLLVQQMRQDIYEEDVLAEMSEPCQAEITIDTQKTRPYLPVFLTVTFNEARFNGAAALERMICHWRFPDHLEEHCWSVCHYFTGKERDSGPMPPPPGAAGASAECDHEGAAAQPQPAEEAPPSSKLPRWLRRILVRLGIVRPRPHPAIRTLWVSATIRGQNFHEANEVPIPPLRAIVKLQPPPPAERSRAGAELIRFLIAMGVAIAGLLSGALDQLDKLEFLPATIAILGLGFSANSVKNLLTQSTTPAIPPKVTSR